MFISILAAILILSGCADEAGAAGFASRPVTFSFSEEEPATLVWYSAANTPERKAVTEEERASGTAVIHVQAGTCTPVLLYPEDGTPPVGCIYPVSTVLVAADGFSARILFRLLTESSSDSGSPQGIREYCARFNWKRFIAEVRKKEDPWEIDQQTVLKAIAQGSFSARLLR